MVNERSLVNHEAAGARVAAVSLSRRHEFSKQVSGEITLVEGHGVVGDCHAGVTVQHLSRIRRDPSQPNLRQVHLIAAELLDELAAVGHRVEAGQLGENILTRGVDLLGLSTGTCLRFFGGAVVEVMGLRNPCRQIDGFQAGLLRRVLGRDEHGEVVRRAGVMGVVRRGNVVRVGETFEVEAPAGDFRPLSPV